MKVELRRCNNIEDGAVEILEQTLNLKFAINGSGKTTIAKAVMASINERQGTDKNALAALTPFRYRKDGAPKPEVIGIDFVQSIKVFDEKYLSDFTFQSDELLKGSFDIFIRGEAYEQGMKEIDAQVASMQKALNEDKDIGDLISDFNEISVSFGKETKSGIHGASGLAKAFKDGNRVQNIPAGLEAYKSYIQHSENYKWVGWQLGGRDFVDIDSGCPYCTSDIQEKRETIKLVGEVYQAKAIENLNKIVSAFSRLNKYFSDDTKAKIAEFVKCVGGYTDDQAEFLREVKGQIDRLSTKFVKAQRLGFSSLKEVDKVIDGLNDHMIDLSLFLHLQSENTKQKVEIVNTAIKKLLEQAGQLQGMIKKQKLLIENLVKENSAGINAFLKNAGFVYQVTLLEDSTGQHRLKLLHSDADGEIANAKTHLSYGERNAFALVLFMYDVLKSNPDLIVLDDPISSFDKNKKYAIVEMLFRTGSGSLRDKTVLLLTHDLEPIVDLLIHHSDRFKKPFATFLQNNNGVLTEKEIGRPDIRTFIEIAHENASAGSHVLNRLIYLRRRLELVGNKGLAFQVISNVLHKRQVPEMNDGGNFRLMESDELRDGTNEILAEIPEFDYEKLIGFVTDDKSMIDLYNKTTSNYEKLHLYRMIFDDKNDLIGSDVIQKFINEAFHIENDYIYQLNPRAFQTVPHFVIEQCDRYVTAFSNRHKLG